MENALDVTDTYDSLNRLTGAYQGTASRVVGYGYDIVGRRSTASYGSSSAAVASTTISYTNADRQKTSVSATDGQFLPSGLAPLAKSYSANNLNQYTAISGTALTYDKRGNLLSDGTWTYGYDTQNRLVSAAKPGLSVTYGYDALGRRLSRKVTNGTVATTYAWLSVGDQEWAEFSGTPSLSFAGATLYGDGFDEPVAGISPANARSYYFQDALGSVVALTNASGQLTGKHAYTAFGLETTVGANAAAYRFAGRRVDLETGLSYNRARTYAPTLGRFLQADPAGTLGGLNLYAYASNDPADITDPSGKWGAIAGAAASFGRVAGPVGAFAVVFTPTRLGDGTTNSAGCGIVGCIVHSEGTAGGDRAGKPFTTKGKNAIKIGNADRNNGQIICESCGEITTSAKKSESVITPPSNEAHVDHIIPKSKGGDGSPSNGQILCRFCNLQKGNKYE